MAEALACMSHGTLQLRFSFFNFYDVSSIGGKSTEYVLTQVSVFKMLNDDKTMGYVLTFV